MPILLHICSTFAVLISAKSTEVSYPSDRKPSRNCVRLSPTNTAESVDDSLLVGVTEKEEEEEEEEQEEREGEEKEVEKENASMPLLLS
jgi:hypothetical protein